MATQASSQLSPSAQVVGNAFVEQYYQILHQSPELVYRFYTDMSVLSRPGPDGVMTSVKTMEAINEVIVSLDYKDYRAEIKTIDAQDSYQSGVVVLVTGWLTVKDNVKRKFTQSFFLAPQDKGYFVLNDVFRYLDEDSQPETNAVAISVEGTTEDIPASAPVTSVPEPTVIPDHPVPDNTTPTPAPAPAPTPTPAVEVVYGNGEVDHEPLSNGEVSVVEIQVVEVPVQSVKTEVNLAPEPASTTPEDTPKKLTQSYASILKDTKATKVTKVAPPVSARTNTAKASIAKVAAGNTEQLSAPAPAPGPGASAPSSNNGANGSNIPEEVEGYSIYVRSLPMNATVPQVEEEFKKFGPIRPNGVQVRSNKGFCFGFVEFEKQSSMQSALEATPVNIGNRQVHVEEKRTTTRVGPGGRPRFPPGRNGFRNDNFRGRGNFSGGRGYGRSEYGNRGDFSGRRSSSGRSGDGYQRVEHNVGNGRVARQGANQTAVSA